MIVLYPVVSTIRGEIVSHIMVGGFAVPQSHPSRSRSSGCTDVPVRKSRVTASGSIAMGMPVIEEVAGNASGNGRQAALAKDWGSMLPVWGVPASSSLANRLLQNSSANQLYLSSI